MKIDIRSTVGATLTAAVTAALAIACSSAPGSDGIEPATSAAEPRASPNPGIHGAPLFSKTLGNEHTIELYEFGAGRTAVHETGSVDSGEKPVLDTLGPIQSLAEVYAKLNPGRAVPSEIAEADQRATQLLADQLASATMSGSPHRPEPATEPQGGRGDRAKVTPATATCSPDELGDGWGGAWFTNNFCNAGGFRWCQQNLGYAYWDDFSYSWATWRQMEGDFNLPGHLTLQDCNCGIWACVCPHNTDADYDVLPRHYEIWTWNPASRDWANGTSQCGHLHVNALWNN